MTFSTRLSRGLAILIGILSPTLETIRRWSTWQQDPLALFDDYIIGGLLLFGAWQVTRNCREGQRWIVLGWGFTAGMMYASIDFQLQQLRAGAVDPAPISTEAVLLIKLVGAAIVLVGVVSSVMKPAEN